jgi:EAL domain-containing protein (putative c-di-GMP-specific phosphodiesterase class I)
VLFPDAFIPLAEQTGLIGPLTAHILDAALAQARRWLDAGQPLVVSVNLSARNLHDDGILQQVGDLLAAHDVPAALLELEVTESAIMADPCQAQRLLGALGSLGVQLSIDDFGAGYTSLAQLNTLPVAELKIDKAFVLTLTEDVSNALIVHSIIELGHNLGLTIVAEGVDTAEALELLNGFGCDTVQGYYFTQALPADAFDAWYADRRRAAATPGSGSGDALDQCVRGAIPAQASASPVARGVDRDLVPDTTG